MPGRGGIARIVAAFRNTIGGLREGLSTEAAIKQEFAIACVAVPLSFFIAEDLWTWVALIASLLIVLAVEFLNNQPSWDRVLQPYSTIEEALAGY